VTRRARLLIAYHGAAFHGFAVNRDVETVAGTLLSAIGKVVRVPVALTGAGRTDAGVHAWGQVISIDLPDDTDLLRLVHRVNSMCGPHVVARLAEWVDDSFDARFSALWRHYRYTILTTATPSPFLADTAWHVREPLDVAAMQRAGDSLIGEHDFATFCRRPKVREGEPDKTLVRRVMSANWFPLDEGLLCFEIRANAFCHQMVRSIVGTLVDVGRGKYLAEQVIGMLQAQDRAVAGTVAPPHGLCLWEVGYSPPAETDAR
jgi:tRNA pseudouridine38-40 synthase